MQQLKDIKEKILSVVGRGEILLIIPPFGSIGDICLAPHILQAFAGENGYKTSILYLNMLLASILGVGNYEKICDAPWFRMLGERLFAGSAYGLPPLGKDHGGGMDEAMSISGRKDHIKMFYDGDDHFDLDLYLQIEKICTSFIDETVSVINTLDYKIVGTTAITGLINCCIALLQNIKKHSPGTITIIGGTNCEGKKAEGIASLSDAVDYIFSGESENAFLNFLKDYSAQKLPSHRIITGEPLTDLDSLPAIDYEVCLDQAGYFLGEEARKKIQIWYETSRGCWWANKSKCTFCGIPIKSFRKRTVNKIVHDLKKIRQLYPGRMIFIADDMMPTSIHKELLPHISQKDEFPSLGYQARPNLDLKDLVNLKNINVNAILPGIESLSTHLLKLMNKGSTGKQNLLLLRNARSVGIYCDWFMLWGFPGDDISDYEQLLEILPLIRHLQPPRRFFPMILSPFSPYVDKREDYNIRNIRPWNVFNMIFPDSANLEKLAMHYTGEFPSESYENPGVIRDIAAEIASWKKMKKKPVLVMTHLMDYYVIQDSRDIHKSVRIHALDYQKAKEIMISSIYGGSENLNWALEQKLGVVVDSWYVPLVTASPELLLEFEKNE